MCQLFDSDYSCSSSKSAAIVKGVFGSRAMAKLKEELKAAKFITISFDGSIIHQKKLLPIFATFFDRHKGIQHRLLYIAELPEEKGLFIAHAIRKTLKKFGIEEKVIAILADNCPTNFGTVDSSRITIF